MKRIIKNFMCVILSLVLFFATFSNVWLDCFAAGNTIASATSIAFDSSYTGSITSTNTTDIYKFNMSSSGEIHIRLTAHIYCTNYYIYDSDGNTIWDCRYQYWDDNTQTYSLDQTVDLTKGTYYFSVVQSDGTGNYNFKLSCAHNYIQNIEKASTSSAGKITVNCSVCNYAYTEPIPRIATIKLSRSSFTYNGYSYRPSLTIKDSNGTSLVKGYDYSVYYKSNGKKVGKHKVVVTFKGEYYRNESKTLYFTVTPKPTSLRTAIANGKKKITIKWKNFSGIDGYEIQIASNKKFTQNAKVIKVKKATASSKTIRKLKSKTKYFIRIRTFKTKNKTVYYSTWSKTKKVTTK